MRFSFSLVPNSLQGAARLRRGRFLLKAAAPWMKPMKLKYLAYLDKR
jgi:hypothetical protein